MSLVRIIDIAFFVVLLFIAIRLLPVAWNMLRIYLGIKTRRLEDASSFAPSPPPAVAALATRLHDLGFRRIGERSTVLPGDKRRFEWDMVDELTTTYVSLGAAGPSLGGVLMICYSAFADGAFVDTSYPSGATVQREDFYAAPGGSTPEEAVAEHRRRVALFSSRHGPALPNGSMADLLVRDDTYRRRHGGITLRTRVYRFVGLTALVTLAAAIQLVRIIAPGW
jgi:hypothetical protein